MKHLLLFLFILTFTACDQQYKVVINMKDSTGLNIDEKEILFESADDSSAYKRAAKEYWIQKVVTRKMNRLREVNDPEPFYFIVTNEKDILITFPADEAERMVEPSIQYLRDQAFPEADTTTPFSKRPKQRTADIY